MTDGPEGMAVRIPVGGVARLTLLEGKVIELGSSRTVTAGGGGGDVISSSLDAEGVVTVRGLRPGGGSVVTLTDDRGGKHSVRVTVAEKGPGR